MSWQGMSYEELRKAYEELYIKTLKESVKVSNDSPQASAAQSALAGEREAYEHWKAGMEPYGFGGLDAFQAGAAWQRTQSAGEPEGLLEWAVGRWHSECLHRPLQNVHRRSLDDTWRQVIRRLGGDPDYLLGPDHSTLLAASTAHQRQEGE